MLRRGATGRRAAGHILAPMSGEQRVVGVISMGAMGAAVTRVMVRAGDRVVTTMQGRSARTTAAATAAGAEILTTLADVVAESDVLWSLVPPDAAVAFAAAVGDATRVAGRSPVFVDGNSIAPATLERVEAAAGLESSHVVDLSIIGPPPALVPPGERAKPQFYVAGQRAEVLTVYREHGLDVRVLGTTPGAAKALKMCYAGVTKGIIALVVDMLLAARRLGVSDELVEQMRATQSDVLRQVERQAEGFAPKAYRWVGEMREMERTFDPLDLPSGFFAAAGETFARLAKTDLGRPGDAVPDLVTLDMILDALESVSSGGRSAVPS